MKEYIIYLILFCEALGACAATNELTLAGFVHDVLARNPELQFYEAELTHAKASRKQAGVFPNPELDTSIGQKRLRADNASAEGVAWSVSVLQPLEWPGRIGLRKVIANRDVELAQLGLERLRAALAARANTVGYTLFVARQKQLAAGEVANRFQALREVLVQRDPAGITPLLETRVIEATELVLQHKAAEAAAAYDSARLEANLLRGEPAGAPFALQAVDFVFRPLPDMAHLQAAARSNNFELRVRQVELAQQGFRVGLARNERYPSLRIGPTYSEEHAGEDERIIGMSLSLPLPIWDRNTANIEAAKARELQAETSLFVITREVERQVAEAGARYRSRLRAMSDWRGDAVQQFREAAALADRHYRLGAVPISTYVELQEKYLEAVESLLETKKGALEAAQAIELLTGLTPPLINTAGDQKK
jgi:outer membrane protein, heavy metal efflux system